MSTLRSRRMGHWLAVHEDLPADGQAVLVRRGPDNWVADHTLINGEERKIWRWETAIFVSGLTHEEAAKRGVFRMEDQFANNLKPYAWKMFGGQVLFGQEVTHWAPISDPCGEGDG